MILNAEREGVIAQPDLLDDVVGRAPRFDFEAIGQAIDRLVMRAVHFFETMGRLVVGPQPAGGRGLSVREVCDRECRA